MALLDNLEFDLTRADTGLYLDIDGRWKRASVNDPMATNFSDLKFRGTWIPKALTNLFRNSEPASDPGQGMRTAISYTAGDLGQFEVDGYVTMAGGGVTRAYYNVASAPANNSLGTVAFLCEKIAGGEPNTNSSSISTADVYPLWGGAITQNEVFKEQYGNYWFIRIKMTAPAVANTVTGLRQDTSYVGTGVRVSAIMAVDGHVDLTLLDYLRTTGASATRAVTDIRNTSFPELASLQGFIDVEIAANGIGQLLNIGVDNFNKLRLIKDSNNAIFLSFLISGNTQFIITSPTLAAGRYRVSWFVESGNINYYIDNVSQGTSTGVYSPNGSNLVLGGDITGTSQKLTDGGFFGLYLNSGITETKLLEESAWQGLEDSSAFKRTTFDNFAFTQSIYNLLASTEL